ncbi:MAG: ornithine cyclodeaminase family protein [Myxococcales bacterium]|nr:ornithine cyclodeaminase family protein [Myxococcales bacterium]
MLTAFLSRADVSRHTQALLLLRDLREALTARVHPTSVQTLQFDAPLPSGSTLVRQASLPGLPAYSVTVRSELEDPAQPSRQVLQLHEATTGKLLAVMDAAHLTSLRASLVSALAADVLARPEACNVAVLGSGAAASGALKALRLVRSLRKVWLHEPDTASNFELAFRLQQSLSMDLHGVDSAAEAVADADLVVLTGQVPLSTETLKAGAHVTVLAAQTFRECPLPAPLLARARRFCDLDQPPLFWGGPFHAELGEVLSKQKDGRLSPDELTVFASQGPAYLDLLAAWHVYEGAKNDESLTRVDLEA